MKDTGVQRPSIWERLRRFSEQGLQFTTERGERLQAEAVLVEPRMRKDRQSPFAGMINPITPALRLSGAVRDRARELAGQMGIGDKLQRHSGELSQGEKQRAAICPALLPNPKPILADEATGNLDPENKRHILELLFDSVAHHDATLLAVTGDRQSVQSLVLNAAAMLRTIRRTLSRSTPSCS